MSPGVLVWTTTAVLFTVGFTGIVLRRQLMAMLLSLELMTNAVNLALVYEARLRADADGLTAVFLLLAVTACEAVVGLSLILAFYRSREGMETAEMKELKG
jgi:NADH-quinone oxidoreductase subunit K